MIWNWFEPFLRWSTACVRAVYDGKWRWSARTIRTRNMSLSVAWERRLLNICWSQILLTWKKRSTCGRLLPTLYAFTKLEHRMKRLRWLCNWYVRVRRRSWWRDLSTPPTCCVQSWKKERDCYPKEGCWAMWPWRRYLCIINCCFFRMRQ